MLIQSKERAKLQYNTLYRCFEVHVGITIVCRGSFRKCENYCQINRMDISNIAEVYRMYRVNNMPEPEGFE